MSTARRPASTGQDKDAQLQEAWLHLQAGRHNTRSLAAALRISTATAARLVEALRRRAAQEGGELAAVRTDRGWHYEVRESEARVQQRWRRFWSLAEAIWRGRSSRKRLKPEDEAIYGDRQGPGAR